MIQTGVETVVSRRSNSRRIHFVQFRLDAEGYFPPEDEIARMPTVCGLKASRAGWLVIPLGLDDPEYGISHITCDRCFDRYIGPQH